MKPKETRDNFLLLKLYVAGESASSRKATANLNAVAKEFLPGKHKIEIVNALDDPASIFDEGVLVTPTLVIKMDSMPVRKIIGDLSDKPKFLLTLGDLIADAIKDNEKSNGKAAAEKKHEKSKEPVFSSLTKRGSITEESKIPPKNL